MKTIDYYIISLRYLLKAKRITQVELGKAIKVDQRNISKVLNKKSNFSDSKKEEIAKFLGTTYLDMLNLGRELSEKKEIEIKNKQITTELEKISDKKARMIKMMYEMMKSMEEKELQDVQRTVEEKIEKKKMEQRLKELEKEIRKAG